MNIQPSLAGISHIFIEILQGLLEKMNSYDPQQRGTLQEAKQTLQELKELIEPNTSNMDPKKQQCYEQQLCILERYN
jgi:hypothetical protein